MGFKLNTPVGFYVNYFGNRLMSNVCCFSDPAVQALQFLDVINMKDPPQKSHFCRNTLKEVLPYIPRVGSAD